MNWLELSNALALNTAQKKGRSAWERGVKIYAKEILADYISGLSKEKLYSPVPVKLADLKQVLLNGADSWTDYSYGGCSLIYDSDICKRLCPPSVIKRFENNNYRHPNKQATWLDVQARALRRACWLLKTLALEKC